MISFIGPCRWAASSAMARSAAEVNRTFQPLCVASRPNAIARWVLPVPLGPQQHQILGTLDEAERRQLLDLGARRAGREGEVVGLERLERWKARRPRQHRRARTRRASRSPLRTSSRKSAQLASWHPAARCATAPIEIGQRTEPQLLRQCSDALMLEGAHATPPSISSSRRNSPKSGNCRAYPQDAQQLRSCHRESGSARELRQIRAEARLRWFLRSSLLIGKLTRSFRLIGPRLR